MPYVHDSWYVHVLMNTASNVNARPKTVRGVEQALSRQLRRLISNIGWIRERTTPRGLRLDSVADATVHLGGGWRVDLSVEIKSELRPSAFMSWLANRPSHEARNAVPVLGLPAVSDRIAELCRQAGWSWFDLAGNCWIDVPGVLHIERSGIPPLRGAPSRRASLATPEAARVVRVLLSPAHAGQQWTQRELRQETCWPRGSGKPRSLGLVNKVVRYLRDEGYVAPSDRGIRVRDPLGLLAAWRRVYRFDRHERHDLFTLLNGQALAKALARAGEDSGNQIAYAAFSAAERQAPHVRQPKTWLYVERAALQGLCRIGEAKEVDSGGNLVVLVPDDPGVLVTFEADDYLDEEQLGCTDPIQTYVDLLHCGGRGEEAAEAILEQRIVPAWKAAGIA